MTQPHSRAHNVHEKVKRHWPAIAKRVNLCLLQMEQVLHDVHKMNAAIVAKFGLHPTDFDVLVSLRISGAPYELMPSEISEALTFTSGGMTKVLARLESKSLIKRKGSRTDGRSRLVLLTERGRDVIEAATDVVVAAEERLAARLSARERRELERLLNKLIG